MKYRPDMYTDSSPLKVTIEYKEDEEEEEEAPPRPLHTDWSQAREQSTWFTDPPHLTPDGTRKSDTLDRTAIEDYLKSMDKMDNLRSSINSLREDLSRSDLHAAEDLYPVDDSVLDAQIWSEGAPRPRLSSSATPYRDQINNLRLKSLRLEEKRLLEVRRLQELERLRGPTPKWYELKTSQFHKEAKKNNEILAAKKQWGSYRDYTESVWKSRDLSRSAPIL